MVDEPPSTAVVLPGVSKAFSRRLTGYLLSFSAVWENPSDICKTFVMDSHMMPSSARCKWLVAHFVVPGMVGDGM